MAFVWIVYDHHGEEIRQTHDFDSRDEAEGWLSANWQSLVNEGGAGVRLASEGTVVYDMGLAEQ
jgi:hypothetical protein